MNNIFYLLSHQLTNIWVVPPIVIVNSVAVIIHVQFVVWTLFSIRYSIYTRSRIAGYSYVYVLYNSMLSLSRKSWTVFHSGCTILHSHQQCTKVPQIHSFLHALAMWDCPSMNKIDKSMLLRNRHSAFVNKQININLFIFFNHLKT